jgi:hypothetical protein
MSRSFLLFIIFFHNGCRKCHLTGNDTNSPLNGLLPKSNYLPEHCFPRRSGSAFLTPPASGYPDSEFTQFVNSSRLNGTQTARIVLRNTLPRQVGTQEMLDVALGKSSSGSDVMKK